MALTEKEKEGIKSWFSGMEWEYAWAEKLQDVVPIYEEMGFTKDTGAILYMLSCLLMQVAVINTIVKRWDEEDEGDAPK